MNLFLKSIKFKEEYKIECEYPSEFRENVITEIEKGYYPPNCREYSNLQRKLLEGNRRSRQLTKEECYYEIPRYYKLLFKEDLEIKFKEGLNIVVGDNGTGKSFLINLIKKRFVKEKGFEIKDLKYQLNFSKDFTGEVIIYDSENDNPIHNLSKKEKGEATSSEIINHLFMNDESHGETTKGVFSQMMKVENCLIILDEPESSLSLKSQYKFFNDVKELSKRNQIIIITHSKLIIEESKEVYDMETKDIMSGWRYIRSIK